jgi:hypothetical protein
MGILLLVVLLWVQAAVGQQRDDLACLLKFKASVGDPEGHLTSWANATAASSARSICAWYGVTCYGNMAPPVYFLKLSGSRLAGTFPQGLNNCNALTRLDLSDNAFTGPIPATLCSDLPNLVSLDLSKNSLHGPIPASLATCQFMNDLLLNQNQLSGSIPEQIAFLSRLQRFDVSSNHLTGPIPIQFIDRQFENRSGFDATSFLNNTSLCGKPLKKCRRPQKGATAGVIVGGAVGSALVVLVIGGVIFCYVVRRVNITKTGKIDESKWASRIKAPKGVVVAMFEKPLVKIRLSDLVEATGGFGKESVVATGRTGVVYKGEFRDGSVMAIKRLEGCNVHNDRQFRAEMETLGELHHRNLVPLLGYCVVAQERLLVYKHMANGSLKYRLHDAFEKEPLDWKTRLKIAIGASRGFAWLHHSCNPRIIHRNISSSCILLDEDFEARITDFGLARLMNPVDTHISTFVNGDFGDVGYVAPEYVRTLVATMRGDVYSFGVVLLELVTAQKPVDVLVDREFKGSLVDWVGMLSSSGAMADALDATLKGKGVDEEMLQVLKIGWSCVNATARDRPSMYEVSGLLRAVGQRYSFSDEYDEFPELNLESERRESKLIVSVT